MLKGKTLLIVEDDAVSAEYMNEIFRDEEVNLIFAKSGEEAISIYRTRDDIAIVLMDIRLPGKDGYEITRKMKELKPEIPVIAQTAYALQGDRQKALDAGCDDYIAKPIRSESLIKMIKNLI